MHSTDHQHALQHIAVALQDAERNQDEGEQIRLYSELLDILPDLALGHAQLARLLLGQGKAREARPHVVRALALPQDEAVDIVLFTPLAASLDFNGDLDSARAWYQAHPSLVRLQLYNAALERGKAYQEAEEVFTSVLQRPLAPNDQAWLLSLLAKLYFDTGRFHESIACSQLSLECNPTDPNLQFNLATALEQVGRYEEAVANFIKVLQQVPQHPGTHNNLALIMLRLGQFEEGWKHYEWRWETSLKEHNQFFNIPRWSGEDLGNKTLLIWAEQGIGDHIMFASLLPSLRAFGGTIHFETFERLDPIFKRSFPDINLIRREQTGTTGGGTQLLHRQSWPRSDFQIPMGSLGAILRPTRQSFEAQQPFLKADACATAQKRDDYQRRFPGKKLIGLSWRGGIDTTNDIQSRKIAMKELSILGELCDVQFINLQYGNTTDELRQATELGLNIYHDDSVDPLCDMDAQASQIAALDAVVSIDNTTVHLAGALGKPTYALLQLNPNWRWGITGNRSLWYPSVRLIRNRELGTWKVCLRHAVEALWADGIL